MGTKSLKKVFSVVLVIAMLLMAVPMGIINVSAVDISGTVYTSSLSANSKLTLTADTVLVVNSDITLASVSGNYNLVIEGYNTLTVSGDINVCDVSVTNTQMTVNGKITVANEFYAESNYFYVFGGISAENLVRINSAHAVIAGTEYGIYCENGNIELNGSGNSSNGISVGAQDNAVYAKNGSIYLTGDIEFSSVDDLEYAVIAEKNILDNAGNYLNLKVTGSSGMIANSGNITLHGTNIDVQARNGFAIMANGGNVDITAEKLVAICEGGHHGEVYYPYGVGANGNVTLDVSDTASIAGRDYGIRSREGDIDLDGGYYYIAAIGNDYNKTCVGVSAASGSVYMYGDIRIISDKGYAIDTPNGEVAVDGSLETDSPKGKIWGQYLDRSINAYTGFGFYGQEIYVKGRGGIVSDYGDVSIITEKSAIVNTEAEVALKGDYIYVEAPSLQLAQINDIGGPSVCAESGVDLRVAGGTIVGGSGIKSEGYISIEGKLTVIGKDDVAISASGDFYAQDDLTVKTYGENETINAERVYFDGKNLYVSGQAGIYSKYNVELKGNNIEIVAEGDLNSGIWSEYSFVYLDGNVKITTNGWYGINAATDLELRKGYYEIGGAKDGAQAIKLGGSINMDASLQIIEPDGADIRGNDICDAAGFPAKNVVIYSPVDEISILVETPAHGVEPHWDSSAVYGLNPLCSFESITWYENGVKMNEGDTFVEDNEYSVKVVITADRGYYFTDGIIGKINGKTVTAYRYNGKKTLELTANIGTCPTAISNVALNITAPVEGNKPSTYVSDSGSEYGVYSRDVSWQVSNDGVVYKDMASTEKFVGGKYYRVNMYVNLASQKYAFNIGIVNDSIEPIVTATVNNKIAAVTKVYDQDPSQIIEVSYDFGKCNDYLIEEIKIVDVVKPVAGEHPSYEANVLGTGYYIDTTRNAYKDIYWKNPPEKWYYIKNGVSWWDVTDGNYDYVYEHDVFLPGHEYQLEVYVSTEDGYEFNMDLYADPEIWPEATVNGNTAGILDFGSNLMFNQEVSYTFTCEEREISTIMINGINRPQAFACPDYTATTAYPNVYKIDTEYSNGIYWFDGEGLELSDTDHFVEGEVYCIAVDIVINSVNGEDIAVFADEVTAYIDGKEVIYTGGWDEVIVNGNVATVYFTFVNGADASNMDINGDRTVDILDLVTLKNAMLNDGTTAFRSLDVNCDGEVNSLDTTALRKYLFSIF